MDFRRAPITKVLVMGCAAASMLCAWVPGAGAALALSAPSQVLSRAPELWRLLTSLAFADTAGAAAAACFLLYRFRLFERQMSSSKFGAFVAASTAFAAASRVGLVALPVVGAAGLASGPFHLVFGLLPLYYRA